MSRILRSAALLAAVSLVATPALASAKARNVPLLKGRTAGLPFEGQQIHGVVLTGVGGDPKKSVADFRRLKADGVNLVSIYIGWQITNSFSSDLTRRSDTPTDKTLSRIATLAHRQGIAVEWMPIVQPKGGAPRYDILPNNMSQWWSKYTAMIDHYAALAAKQGIEVFSIGSEYGALQKYTSNWNTIISHVRHKDGYHGLTTYMSTTGAGFNDLGWWGNVDLLSVSPYWSLSPAKLPTVNNLVKAWRDYFLPQLKDLYTTYHKPVLMDEIGYPNQDYAADHPAVAWRNTNTKPNPQAQANAYEALLKVAQMPVYKSWLKGVVWFYWGAARADLQANADTGYSPRAKKAECVVAQYWAKHSAGSVVTGRSGQTCFAGHIG